MISKLFKTEKSFNRVLHLHPIALLILMDMWHYCKARDLEFLVTETVTTLEEDEKLERKSNTHRTGRAFDLRNRSWTRIAKDRFINYFNDKYFKYGAITSRGRKLIVDIPHGTGPHFHIQLDAVFSQQLETID